MIIRGDWVRLIRDVEGYFGVVGAETDVQVEDPPDKSGQMSFVMHGYRYVCSSDDVEETAEPAPDASFWYAEEA